MKQPYSLLAELPGEVGRGIEAKLLRLEGRLRSNENERLPLGRGLWKIAANVSVDCAASLQTSLANCPAGLRAARMDAFSEPSVFANWDWVGNGFQDFRSP